MHSRLRALASWWRVCPLWYRAEDAADVTIRVTPKVFGMTLGNSFQGGKYNFLNAEWDNYDEEAAAKSRFHILISIPPDVVS